MIQEATKMREIPFSGIRKMMEAVTKLEAEGEKICHMEIGRPDFDTPSHIKKAAITALEQGLVHYGSNYGIQELREVLAEKLRRENSIPAEAKNVIVTIGANEAIFMAMMAFLDRGDAVLIPDPGWTHYANCAKLAGADIIPVILQQQDGYKLTRAQLETAITPACKMLVINSPNNPTGAVIDRETLIEIADFAVTHDLLILADEIYEKILYNDVRHFSIGSLPQVAERCITINGFSKAYAMDGWRLGYLAAHEKLMGPLIRVHQYSTVCVCTFAQKGAVAAVTGPQDCVFEMTAAFAKRRALVCSALDAMGIMYHKPEGAFYVFPDIRFTGLDSEAAAAMLLREAKIATVPGNSFGAGGEGYLRMAFSSSYEQLETGLSRMQTVIRRFRSQL